jgi:putative addiction module component (TIGR02574 family)
VLESAARARPRDVGYNDRMASAEKVLTDALALPANDRARVAQALLRSLDEGDEEDAADAWRDELQRRLDDLDAGRVTPLSVDDLKQRMADRRAARLARR